jgi:hypothetical protein
MMVENDGDMMGISLRIMGFYGGLMGSNGI